MAAVLPQQLIIFELDKEAFALDVTVVQEILPEISARPIPQSALHIEGVFDFRGKIIPLINLREVLKLPLDKGVNNVIVINYEGRLFGLIVDRVLEVFTGQTELRELPPAGLRVPARLVQSVVLYKEMVVVVLHLKQLASAVIDKED